MWLVLPFFGRALTSTLLQQNVGLVSAFLANVSLTGLAYVILNTNNANGGLSSTAVGANLLAFLSQRGIVGPFASVYGYWMIVAAFIGKVIWISLMIGISPILGAFIYWMFKSLGLSVYYIQASYDVLPDFVKQYFIYLNTEIMNLYNGWFSPTVETTKNVSKYIFFWKICLNMFSWIGGTAVWAGISESYVEPFVGWITSFQYVYQLWLWSQYAYFFIAGVFVSIMPTFATNFIIWLFSVEFLQNNWGGRLWGWIGRITGWW